MHKRSRWLLAAALLGAGACDETDGVTYTIAVQAEQFLRPPAAFPVQWSAGTAPAARTLFAGDLALVVSALKPADTGPGAMLHAHNPTRQERRADVPGVCSRLDETPVAGDGMVGPFAIAAWHVRN